MHDILIEQHKYIILWAYIIFKQRIRNRKCFKYEEGWTVQDGCTEAVKAGWESECVGSPMFRVTEKNKATRQRNELYTRLHSLLAQEEAFWHQRCKENWMRLGDQNACFFHQKVNRRQRRNGLCGWFDEAGGWHEDKRGVHYCILFY